MTLRERLRNTFDFKPCTKIPVVEWASYWNLTYDRWLEEGLPQGLSSEEAASFLGCEYLKQYWIAHYTQDFPAAHNHGNAFIVNENDYNALKQCLFPKDAIARIKQHMLTVVKPQHDSGELPVWMTLEGFFWFPRVLLGIENHLYSFYDEPALYHRICSDLAEFHLKCIDEFCEILIPDFVTIAEDMSYNGGSMISKEIFDAFLLPYYKRVLPALKERDIRVFVDTDGYLHSMIPWLIEAGFEGAIPLERQAAVDVNFIRKQYPNFRMIGGFDKMCLKHGESAIRAELDRLYPAMVSGGYLPSMDHQTPPDCTLEHYKIYIKLLTEYCERAATALSSEK